MSHATSKGSGLRFIRQCQGYFKNVVEGGPDLLHKCGRAGILGYLTGGARPGNRPGTGYMYLTIREGLAYGPG